jgi:hypothetical protein
VVFSLVDYQAVALGRDANSLGAQTMAKLDAGVDAPAQAALQRSSKPGVDLELDLPCPMGQRVRLDHNV